MFYYGVFYCSAGIGQIDHHHLEKKTPEVGMLIIKIGGPAYRIGMGGGAASSVPSGGSSRAELDFNAVQASYTYSSEHSRTMCKEAPTKCSMRCTSLTIVPCVLHLTPCRQACFTVCSACISGAEVCVHGL